MTLGDLRKALDNLPTSADSAPIVLGDNQRRLVNNLVLSLGPQGTILRLYTIQTVDPVQPFHPEA